MKNYNSITVMRIDGDITTVDDLDEILDHDDDIIIGIKENMYVVFKKDCLTSWIFEQKTVTDEDEQKEKIELIEGTPI